MKPSIILERHREAIRHLAARHHTVNPRVFGSVIKGADRNSSDLDLLVDPLPGVTLFDLGGLQVELEELIGMPVDLMTPDDIPRKFRNQVLAEAKPV